MLSVISGPDAGPNGRGAARYRPSTNRQGRSISGLRDRCAAASPPGWSEPGVESRSTRPSRRSKRLGARVSSVELPHSALGIAVYYIVATAEASVESRPVRRRALRRARAGRDARRDVRPDAEAGFGAEVKRRIMLGTYVLSAGYHDAYYVKAQQVRSLIRHDYVRALATVDVVAMPTTPEGAFRLGARTSDPLPMYLADVFTVGASLAGLPAVSVPCGFTHEKLPVAPSVDRARVGRIRAAQPGERVRARNAVGARAPYGVHVRTEMLGTDVPGDLVRRSK